MLAHPHPVPPARAGSRAVPSGLLEPEAQSEGGEVGVGCEGE